MAVFLRDWGLRLFCYIFKGTVLNAGMEYKKGIGTGKGQIVAFMIKETQVEVLDEFVGLLAGSADPSPNRSDVIRMMVLPWMQSLVLAKQGKPFQGVLELTRGMIGIQRALKKAQRDAAQAELDFGTSSVLEVPS